MRFSFPLELPTARVVLLPTQYTWLFLTRKGLSLSHQDRNTFTQTSIGGERARDMARDRPGERGLWSEGEQRHGERGRVEAFGERKSRGIGREEE